MRVLLFFFVILMLLGELLNLKPHQAPKKYLAISLSSANSKTPLYRAMITGNKSSIPSKLKSSLISLGLMHLFTPSGLHLSSLFFLNLLPRMISFNIFIGLILFLWPFNAYHSMIRVLIFKSIYKLSPQLDLRFLFLLTFFIAITLGQFRENPISLLFSCSFWGIILFSKRNPIRISIRLSLLTIAMNTLMGQMINPLIFVLNPLITGIIVLLFPFLFLNAILPDNLEVNLSALFGLLSNLAQAISSVAFTLGFAEMMIFLILITKRSRISLIICLLVSISLSEKESLPPKKFINLPPPKERIEIQKKAVKYIDRSCNYNLKCNLRNHRHGGYQL